MALRAKKYFRDYDVRETIADDGRMENLPNMGTTYHWQYAVDRLPELQFELND